MCKPQQRNSLEYIWWCFIEYLYVLLILVGMGLSLGGVGLIAWHVYRGGGTYVYAITQACMKEVL
jgi:hypothetical protein